MDSIDETARKRNQRDEEEDEPLFNEPDRG
jgi:hypothetical protein